MKSIARSVISILACAMPFLAMAQAITPPDKTFSDNFRCEVKTLEEFTIRFNGEESHPDVPDDSLNRKGNLCALFDAKEVLGKRDKDEKLKLIYEFCDSVVDNNVRISLDGGMMYVVADCRVIYDGKKQNIKLGLLRENLENDITRWGIFAVSGLKRSGIIKTQKLHTISPVEHEIMFMGLSDLINLNPDYAFGYRYSTNDIDQLSVFLTLAQAGLIKFDLIESMNVYCVAVPGFIFEISERVRDSRNSGWLITTLTSATVSEKIDFLNNLFKE